MHAGLVWCESHRMGVYNDEAIVLRRLDFSETSQVLVFFTRDHGLQRLLGKGLKRGTKTRFATGIDLLEQGKLLFATAARSEGGLGQLREWRQVNAHLALRANLNRWYAAQYAAEITAGMCEEADAHPGVFDALVRLYEALAAGAPVDVELTGYQRMLLESAGIWPELSRCIACDRPAPPGRAALFAVHQGGVICRQCAVTEPNTRHISAGTLTALREGRADPACAAGIIEMLDYVLSQALGRPTSLRHSPLLTGGNAPSSSDQ